MSQDILDQLYPWQSSGDSTGPADLAASISAKVAASHAAREAFFSQQTEALIAAASALAECFAAGGRLFTMGNGGSACDAAHIAVEFNHPVTAGRRALPSVDLAADTVLLTALANDVGVEQIFLRPLAAPAKSGDALIGVSTSGNSSNLLPAFEWAQQNGLVTIALSGAGGGALAQSESVQHCLTVPADSVHRVQETHVLMYHLLWDLVHSILANAE